VAYKPINTTLQLGCNYISLRDVSADTLAFLFKGLLHSSPGSQWVYYRHHCRQPGRVMERQLRIQRVSSVKTQLIYSQLKWPHVSTHRVIIRPISEPCLRYIKWKCTFLGSQNFYKSKKIWIQMRLVFYNIINNH